jgi:poly(A) polymerase
MHTTKRILLDEFKRADGIVNSITGGKKPWADLFERHTFFTKDHKYYLSVVAASRTKEAHDSFTGLVNSKIRLLVKGIEDGYAGVDLARPYNDYFVRYHRCADEDEIERVVQGNLGFQVSKDDLEKDVPEGVHTIYTATFYIGLTLPEGELETFFFN